MKYILDTNVVSELQKSNCNSKVRYFINEIPAEDLFLCAFSIGEMCYGVEKLPVGKKKHELAIWLYVKLPQRFNERILSLDSGVMMEWGKIRARANRTMPYADTLIAATAIVHHMTLVTRNTKDFEDIEGINLLNPWD